MPIRKGEDGFFLAGKEGMLFTAKRNTAAHNPPLCVEGIFFVCVFVCVIYWTLMIEPSAAQVQESTTIVQRG